MFKTIVVGTDGSEHGQHAVAFTADLAAQLEAQVVLVHAEQPFPPTFASAGGYIPYVPQSVIDETHAMTRRRVKTEFTAPLRSARVRYQTRVMEGPPAKAVAEVAAEVKADLIVVGTRGLHALGEFFLGSTSHTLTQHAPVPVVVVPPPSTIKTRAPEAPRPVVV